VAITYWAWGYKNGYYGLVETHSETKNKDYIAGYKQGAKDRKKGLPSFVGNEKPLAQKELF